MKQKLSILSAGSTLCLTGFLLCAIGAYAPGCVGKLTAPVSPVSPVSPVASGDGFVLVRKESLDPATGNTNSALYQRKDKLGVGQSVYTLSITGHYQYTGTLSETD